MRISLISVLVVVGACGPKPAVKASPAGGAPAATNTSIASARPLAPGTTVEFQLPCDGSSIFFGPFAFETEGQALAIDSSYASPSGTQICGGGKFVDDKGDFVTVAGLGCPEGTSPTPGQVTYAYTPGAGGSNANPLFLELAVADPRPAGCVLSGGTLTRRSGQ